MKCKTCGGMGFYPFEMKILDCKPCTAINKANNKKRKANKKSHKSEKEYYRDAAKFMEEESKIQWQMDYATSFDFMKANGSG